MGLHVVLSAPKPGNFLLGWSGTYTDRTSPPGSSVHAMNALLVTLQVVNVSKSVHITLASWYLADVISIVDLAMFSVLTV
jgi:hypothetical protein